MVTGAAAAKHPELDGLTPVLIGPKSDLALFVRPEIESGVRQQWDDGRSVTTTVSWRLELVDGYAGQYAAQSFRVDSDDGRPLTAEVIRSMKISETLSNALYLVVQVPQLVRLTPARRAIRDVGLFKYDLDDDERACVTYTEAKLQGLDTNQWIANALNITPGAAAQRIRRLRQRGQLPPSQGQGKRR